MKNYFYASAVVLVCTTVVLGLIILGGALPPGFVDPVTHRVRFVSDGFKDYRPLPYICLGFLGVIIFCFFLFAKGAGDGKTVFVMGILSLGGFGMVASFPEGTIHITGAGCFIFSYAFMQLALDNTLWDVHRGSRWSRMLEYGILSIAVMAAVLFCVLLGVSTIMGGDPTLHSWSAVFEYVVFVSFIALNTYGMSLMTYITRWYKVGEEGGGKWVQKGEESLLGGI